MNHIGTLQESQLHAALKEWIRQPGDQVEIKVDGSIIDLVRGDLLIEVQTRNFMGIKHKLTRLTRNHPVRLVYPIAHEKWILKVEVEPGSSEEKVLSRRKSPKRGRREDVFAELVYIASLIKEPNLILELLFIREDEVWTKAHGYSRRSWRRGGWQRHDRRLIEVIDHMVLQTPNDFRCFVPASLPEAFTNRELATAMRLPRFLAERMSYSLRQMGVLEAQGKRGKAWLFRRTPNEA